MAQLIIYPVGYRFGRLAILERVPVLATPYTHWKVRCDCGQEKVVTARHLRRGDTRSCGCLHKEIHRIRLRTHGKSHTPTWNVWQSMLRRCETPSATYYRHYGGRGITVCQRWKKFEHFLADMGERPPGLELDRINNDGNYEPKNCKWSSKYDQCNNRRCNRIIVFAGQRKTLSEWARSVGLRAGTLAGRLKSKWDMERALLAPTSHA